MAWVLPTEHNDPDSKWNNETQAYDENTGTGADSPNDTARTWGSYIELNIASISCDKIRYYALYNANINEISVDVYYSSAWHNIFEGTHTNQTWEEKAIGSTQNVTAARVRFYAKKVDTAYLYEFEFNEVAVGFEYIGTGSFTYSGTAIQIYTSNYFTTASGQLVYSGEAEILFLTNYLYIGNGDFVYSGNANCIYTVENAEAKKKSFFFADPKIFE